MSESPAALILETTRLRLRPFRVEDAADVERLAGERHIAAMTHNVPHPYPAGAALDWIRTHGELRTSGTQYPFAVTRRSDDVLVASCGLKVRPEPRIGEIGYWVGKAYRGQGIATEAAAAVLAFGFDTLELHKIVARAFARNRASAEVLRRIGLQPEGYRREHFLKWGTYEDVEEFGLLRSVYRETRRSPSKKSEESGA